MNKTLSERDIVFVIGKANFAFFCCCTEEYIDVVTPFGVSCRNNDLYHHSENIIKHQCRWCRLLNHLGMQLPVQVTRNLYDRTFTFRQVGVNGQGGI